VLAEATAFRYANKSPLEHRHCHRYKAKTRSIHYRVNSNKATQFRIWATQILKEYIVKGFAMDDERLKNGKYFGKDYFKELLERVRSTLFHLTPLSQIYFLNAC
jgi:hypothetical protein